MWALIIITMRLHTTNQLFSDTKKNWPEHRRIQNNDLITVLTSTCSVSEKQSLWTRLCFVQM